jgi:hypothetical protein
MPNVIKYSASTQTNALKSGNFWVGIGDADKGPTGTTGYWNGINPPVGGYTFYLNKAANGPSVYTAANSSQLINLVKMFSGTTFGSAAACINWANDNPDYMIVNQEFPMTITDGLQFAFDTDYSISHSSDGTDKWYDMIGGASYTNGSGADPVWMNGVDEITICCLLEKTASTVGQYAYHPISKWNSAYNLNASFVLYQFDDYQGNGNDGILGWYGYTQNSGWTNLTDLFIRMFPNQTLMVSMTYSSQSGGQMWINDTKVGGLASAGAGALGNTNHPTGVFGMYGPMQVGPLRVRQALFYDRVLSDMEMYYNYAAVQSRVVF